MNFYGYIFCISIPIIFCSNEIILKGDLENNKDNRKKNSCWTNFKDNFLCCFCQRGSYYINDYKEEEMISPMLEKTTNSEIENTEMPKHDSTSRINTLNWKFRNGSVKKSGSDEIIVSEHEDIVSQPHVSVKKSSSYEMIVSEHEDIVSQPQASSEDKNNWRKGYVGKSMESVDLGEV